MNWKEFKEEWKKLEPARKNEIYCTIGAILCSTIIMIWGISLFHDYTLLLSEENRLANLGTFMFATGAYLFNYFGYRYHGNRIGRLEDRIEKLEGKDEE